MKTRQKRQCKSFFKDFFSAASASDYERVTVAQ